jgi:hypothetical protein
VERRSELETTLPDAAGEEQFGLWMCPTSGHFPLAYVPGRRLPTLFYGRNYSLTFSGRVFAGKRYDKLDGGEGDATLLLKPVEMRHCGEIAKRDGEGVIGQNTNRRFKCGFQAHSNDGIASLLAR